MQKLVGTSVIVLGLREAGLPSALLTSPISSLAVSALSLEWLAASVEKREDIKPDVRDAYRTSLKLLRAQIEHGGGHVLGISVEDLAAWRRIQLLDLIDAAGQSMPNEERLVISTAMARGLSYVGPTQPWNQTLRGEGLAVEEID